MDYRKFLLPHAAMYVGLGLAIVGACGFFLCDIDFVKLFSYIALTIGLLLVAASREKNEDEYITFIRMRTIFFMTVICVLYTVVHPLIDYLAVRSCSLAARSQLSMLLYAVSQFPSILLLYIIMFRLSLIQPAVKEYAE